MGIKLQFYVSKVMIINLNPSRDADKRICHWKTGHPSTWMPGAVGQVVKGQWSETSKPYQIGPLIFFICNVKKSRTAEKAIPASNPADRM